MALGVLRPSPESFGRAASLQQDPRLLCALRPAKKIELHHGDVATLVELKIRDFEHGRAFGRDSGQRRATEQRPAWSSNSG